MFLFCSVSESWPSVTLESFLQKGGGEENIFKNKTLVCSFSCVLLAPNHPQPFPTVLQESLSLCPLGSRSSDPGVWCGVRRWAREKEKGQRMFQKSGSSTPALEPSSSTGLAVTVAVIALAFHYPKMCPKPDPSLQLPIPCPSFFTSESLKKETWLFPLSSRFC